MSSSGGRLNSRGNSYSQVAAPTVAATNAQGKLAQPTNPRQLNISAPIPHPEPYISDEPSRRPSSQRLPAKYSQPSGTVEPARSHKRSSTLSNVFGRSGSLFGSKSQPQSPGLPGRNMLEKRYPPTSMKGPIMSDSPRHSSDSRRPSFGFSRKNSDLSTKEKKRFSLLPASFSLKNITGSSKSQAADFSRQSSSQGNAFARGQSGTDSDESLPNFDGGRDPNRHVSAPISSLQTRQNEIPPRGSSQQPHDQFAPRHVSQPLVSHSQALQPAPQFNQSAPLTASDVSVNRQHRPIYPVGFNSLDEIPSQSMQQGRGGRGGVLQKANRKFADAFEQDQDSGHAGSSGAAKRVMDFFRRRGKARSGDDQDR
jgi:protein-serine/threonine kinase